jgi:3-phenylpropionate/cinnamic acid dioxygenase small subunit
MSEADRRAIDDLLTAYAWALDTKHWDGLADVFTSDATIDYTSAGGVRGSYPEVRQWLEATLAPFPMTQHLVTNRRVVVDGDTARADSYFFNPMQTADGSQFFVGGYYHDRLVRTAAGWRIAERIEETAWFAGSLTAPPADAGR